MVGVTLGSVVKDYASTRAVDDVSLNIRRGELFFLLGPSGCGKTTILRMIAGFLRPDAGTIHFDNRPIDRVPPHKRNTGMVFQSYALWPHMTVAENVAYGLHERRLAASEVAERTKEALQTVRMLRYHDRMPNQLSGGQQQRVALARALVIEPDVVLMDEPLSNLDAKLRLEMRREIASIHAHTGITMIYVTHDQKEALSMADRLAVMSMGQVQQIGTPREVYRRPANRFVAGFIGEANFIDGEVARVDGESVTAHTAAGEFRGVATSSVLKPGDAVSCMIRPESILLGGSATNTIDVTVKGSMYLGEVEQYVLECAGAELLALQANPNAQPPTAGERIRMAFDADDMVVLPATDREG